MTAGEPAGIGPELVVRLVDAGHHNVRVYGDCGMMNRAAERIGSCSRFSTDGERGTVWCSDHQLGQPESPGLLDSRNSQYVLDTITDAAKACLSGDLAAMVTAPVHKGIINDSGIPFSGHTEYLAELCGVQRVVMLLAAGPLRVALATTHLPLRDVSDAITRQRLQEVFAILHKDLKARFRLEAPRIAVLGLNPHAGENGHLGREELDTIAPLCELWREQGYIVEGPLPADTAFVPRNLDRYDAVLAMYHDQGLPVLKHAGFGESVNVTLGLPVIRTSVDHGTALDLAGQGVADAGSMLAAFAMANTLIVNRK